MNRICVRCVNRVVGGGGRRFYSSDDDNVKKTVEQVIVNIKGRRSKNTAFTMLKVREVAAEDAKPITEEEKILGRTVVKAAESVSKILGGELVKSEILKKLISVEKETLADAQPGISDLLSSMSVSKESVFSTDRADQHTRRFRDVFGRAEAEESGPTTDEPQERQREDFQHRFRTERGLAPGNLSLNEKQRLFEEHDRKKLAKMKEQFPETYPPINIFEGPRLNIFQADKLSISSTTLMETWNVLETNSLKLLTNAAPRNGWEEMVQWTEEGKMFPYPIDNEFGFFEKHIGFHEHVFLQHLVEDGFPNSEPIRQFMELVAVGLSKNPYMTVEKKRNHIEWFREYFAHKAEEIDKLKAAEDEQKELKQLTGV